MAYHNPTKGARAIHLTNGTHVLVEPGATADIDEAKVRRLAPGLVKAKNKLPPVPKDLAAKVEKPKKVSAADEIKALRAEYEAKLGKKPFNGWKAAALREKIAAA